MVPGRVRGRGGPAGTLALGAGCVSRDARRDGPGHAALARRLAVPASSGARRSRSSSSCRSHCRGSSPGSRSRRPSRTLASTFGLLTIIVGHATFCIVVVYNNALARLRRLSASFEEASADLGADSWQTFRYVTFPELRTPLLAGGAARLRALVRRGHRHAVHLRCAADASDLDLRQPPAPTGAACRQRRRAVRARGVDRPGLLRAETEPGRCDGRPGRRVK